MYKKLSVFFAAVLLAACGKEPPKPALACNNPANAQSVREQIQQIVKQQAKQFAGSDSRQFVDADKVIAAASELQILLDNPQEVEEGGRAVCSAQLQIRIPSEIFSSAESGSALIYGDTPLTEWVNRKIMGSNMSFANQTFSMPVRYIPSEQGGLEMTDNTVSVAGQTLSSLLLPYGVKSILMIDGEAVSKENAIKMLKNQTVAEPPEASPQDILENNAASDEEGVPQAEEEAVAEPEILRPDVSVREEEPGLSANELDGAREQNRRADGEINRIWGGMERGVQQGLLDEQRAWIRSKTQNCRQAGAGADNAAQSEYRRLQCDTRMTRERIQYLKAYSIAE